MVVHHAGRLHKRITDGTADKLEAVFFELLCHGI